MEAAEPEAPWARTICIADRVARRARLAGTSAVQSSGHGSRHAHRPPLPESGSRRERVRVAADRVVIEDLTLVDAGLAAFVRDHAEEARASLAVRALRIGLTALQAAGPSMDMDVVRREFETLLQRTESLHERVASPGGCGAAPELRRR